MEITLIKQSELWNDLTVDVESVLALVLKQLEIDEPEKAVAVVLTDDVSIQELNHDFRQKDKPTNVLSFPSDEPDEWGDIIFAHETITREATEQNKHFDSHLSHLLVHGMLHLLGYDHIEEADAREMESLEIEILEQLAIENPYEST